MVDIQSATAEIRRRIKKEEDRCKSQGKNIMAPLLHRAAIKRKKKKETTGRKYNVHKNLHLLLRAAINMHLRIHINTISKYYLNT